MFFCTLFFSFFSEDVAETWSLDSCQPGLNNVGCFSYLLVKPFMRATSVGFVRWFFCKHIVIMCDVNKQTYMNNLYYLIIIINVVDVITFINIIITTYHDQVMQTFPSEQSKSKNRKLPTEKRINPLNRSILNTRTS